MNQQKMFAEEQYIRNVVNKLGSAIKYEQDRYASYKITNPNAINTLDNWKDRITAFTHASNLLTDYLTDYTVNMHGVLKYLSKANKEVANANITLRYMEQLFKQKTKQEAAFLAENLVYDLIGDKVNKLLPELRAVWLQGVEGEVAIYEKVYQERRAIHG